MKNVKVKTYIHFKVNIFAGFNILRGNVITAWVFGC